MAKERKTIKVRLPQYKPPQNKWRKEIISRVNEALKQRDIIYADDICIELEVLLYFPDSKISFIDVDNRLKDVMDALQGRVGGPKSIKQTSSIISNDHQIFKVTVEKRRSPNQSKGEGHLTIRMYNP